MAVKNLHDKPFDDATLSKLEIFEKYTLEWLPTFVMQSTPIICIYDFFAGTGYDKNGIAGSSIRILEATKRYLDKIRANGVKVVVYLNEYDISKYILLKESVTEYFKHNLDVAATIQVIYSNEDFDVAFSRLLPVITRYPSLVVLDQNGIKFLSPKNLLALESTTQTDFLFFMSSSYVRRFGHTKEFSVLEIDIIKLQKSPYKYVHRDLVNELKTKLPSGSALKLYPFSIKKGTNIYGIVFGAKHPVALEKFLNVAWQQNGLNGSANFDIEDDAPSKEKQLSLFERPPKQNKVEKFNSQLEELIKQKKEVTNFSIYFFALGQGHPPKHAKEYLQTLKKLGKIHYRGSSPKISYEAIRSRQALSIKWLGTEVLSLFG